jgi:hypothetical protein
MPVSLRAGRVAIPNSVFPKRRRSPAAPASTPPNRTLNVYHLEYRSGKDEAKGPWWRSGGAAAGRSAASPPLSFAAAPYDWRFKGVGGSSSSGRFTSSLVGTW